ncbi:MAG: aromatic ring-hydroxylating dioxygenase subunit alpha [Pseudomonadota bacterium]
MATGQFQKLPDDVVPAAPLAPWTYHNDELFELEYEACFLRRWQLVGHISEVPESGDYITHDIGRDNVFVMRGKDGRLRAFLNVCRHRASRILEGSGRCRGVVRCPYHGWTYQLDGTLLAIPQDEHFPGIDRSAHGLYEVEVETYFGFLFVRVRSGGASIAEHFGEMSRFFRHYQSERYVLLGESTYQTWQCNWKIAWDNYLENYHIPIGHPGLQRLITISDDEEEWSGGTSYGIFEVRSKPSKVDVERRYQELFAQIEFDLHESVRDKWAQLGLAPNHGIDFYPEVMDLFQIVPLAHDKTAIRVAYYGDPDVSAEIEELRRLNVEIANQTNDEDKTLCERVQKGVVTTSYTPGPLSNLETGVHFFHEYIREQVPVAALPEAPVRGRVAETNTYLQEKRLDIGDGIH